MKENTAILVEDMVVNNIELTLKQEYDVAHLCEHIELHKRVMIRGMYAGGGKSYCCEHMTKMGHKVLFVCPTNVLCIKYGVNGITLKKFFGLGMTETSKMAKFNDFMNECHETLLKNGIHVSTVKTDAFTISEGNLEKAKQLLNFEVGIGSWRVSKTEDIKFSYVKLEMKENTAMLV